MLSEIAENRFIDALARKLARSPRQVNGRHQTDAEIVRLTESCTLAVTTDSLAEEIAAGLYSDPYLIGWMTVMINLSDLAAVGADPVGLVISEILEPWRSSDFITRIHDGIQDACELCGTYVLGGDTNFGERLVLAGTAVGLCPDGTFLSRTGCTPGHLVCATESVGSGNAYAYLALLSKTGTSTLPSASGYRPVARIKHGSALRHIASSCMDTSDGVLAALDQMMRLNGSGFEFNPDWQEALAPSARSVAEEAGIPPWLLLAGQHGEYELLFTVDPESLRQLQAGVFHFQPVVLGKVVSKPAITIPLYGQSVRLDTAHIRNIAGTGMNPQSYFKELLEIDTKIREGANHAGI